MTFSTTRCIFAALTVNALTLTSAIAQSYPTGGMVGAYYPPVNSTIAVEIDHNHRVAGGGASPTLYNPYRN